MPLPLIPLILGGAALVSAATGVKKGVDAKKIFDEAREIADEAKEKHARRVKSLEREREITNEHFVELGKLKVHVFSDQINRLVQEVKKRKNAVSKLKDFEQMVDQLDLPQMEKMVESSMKLEMGVLSAGVSGALAGMGAFGAVGTFASASTGTAIASLSGIAAQNATLAWLGGGSLAAGGLGVAGGTMVLGGIVAGPAIAVLGFVMASRAEEALTQAEEYEAEVSRHCRQIDALKLVMQGLRENANEMQRTIARLAQFFDNVWQDFQADSKDEQKFHRVMTIGVALKKLLEMPIMLESGEAVENMKGRIGMVLSNSGVLELE